jgi:hypothetical protein
MERLINRCRWATRVFVSGLAAVFACATCGVRPVSVGAALRGAPTSAAAARPAIADRDSLPRTLASWRPESGFGATAASGDTTEVDFPEELEKREHLYRDIGIFLLVSAFVGYFIVKVFLEGDTDEPPPKKNGKDIPGP